MLKLKKIHVNPTFNLSSMLCYFIMIPFLHPRGFDEYSSLYKNFFTAWLYGSLAIIIALYCADVAKGKARYNKSLMYMLSYFGLSIIITMAIQHGLGVGLQKMIAAPVLCMVCAYYLRHDTRVFLDCLCNLLIIVLGLTVVVFNSFFFGQYFRDEIHLMFIGHVQIGAQLGLLGIFLAFLLNRIRGEWSWRTVALLTFSVGTMVMSLTSSSFLSLFVLIVGLTYMKISKSGKLLRMNPDIFLIIYLTLNVALLGILMLNNWLLPFNFLSLNGRNHIWKEGIRLVSERKLFGYGVHGVLIKVFWSKWNSNGRDGMNYAHNQMIQVLLDGGIVLFISFLMMLRSYIQPLKKVEKSVGAFARICLMAVIVVMVVESTFEYYYILLFLSLIAYLPEIMKIEYPIGRMKGVLEKYGYSLSYKK